MEEKVSTLSEFKEKLVGIKTRPEIKKDKYPAIILVHGFGVDKHEKGMFDELAELLAKNEFITFRFDFSGRGESEGDYSKQSITKMKSELTTILNYVTQDKQVDSPRIGLVAQSFGTPVTIALIPKVQAIVLTGSISNVYEQQINSFKKRGTYNPTGVSMKRKSNGQPIQMGPQFWVELQKYNLINNIKEIKCPILFIHGSEDDKVPLSEMENYYNNANEPKKKYILEGANHDLKPKREIAFKKILDWFNKYSR